MRPFGIGVGFAVEPVVRRVKMPTALMQWLPVIVVVPALCFLGAYGIQKRQRWAWYAGWVVAFFVSGAIAFYTMAVVFNAETTLQLVAGILLAAGGAAVWTFWAVWWATHRDEFLRKQGKLDSSDNIPPERTP